MSDLKSLVHKFALRHSASEIRTFPRERGTSGNPSQRTKPDSNAIRLNCFKQRSDVWTGMFQWRFVWTRIRRTTKIKTRTKRFSGVEIRAQTRCRLPTQTDRAIRNFRVVATLRGRGTSVVLYHKSPATADGPSVPRSPLSLVMDIIE